jgi:hypothetical protein
MPHQKLSCAAIFLLFICPCMVNAFQGREQRYYRTTELTFGNLVISHAHVRVVGLVRNSREYDVVQMLVIDRGHVRIRANGVVSTKAGSADQIEGEIGEGTDSDPAATLRGTFRWDKGKLVECDLESLHMRLKKTTGNIPITGGMLIPSPAGIIFIDNKATISFSGTGSKGLLSLTLPNARIDGAKISLQNVAFNLNLKSRPDDPPVFEVDLMSGTIAPARAAFHSDSARIAKPALLNFYPHEDVTSSEITLQGTSVEFNGGQAHLHVGTITLEHPAIKVKGHQQLPIAAVDSYIARDVTSDSQSGQLTYSNLHSAKAYARSDPWELANRLNGAGVFAPDVLLPVPNSDLRYVKLSDLVKLYEMLGINDPSKTTITRVVIQQDDGMITKISIDTIPAQPPKDALQIEHPICVFVDNAAGGIAAGMAVEALLGDLPLAAGTAAWLRVTSPLNPWIAGPSFYGAFAVSEKALEFVKDTIGDAAGNYCEVLIAHMPNHYTIGESDYVYHPVVFEGISVSPDYLFQDELSMRYQLYLGRAIKASTLRHDPRYRELTLKMSAMNSVLKTVRGNASQIRDLNLTKQAARSQQWATTETARKEEIDRHEAGNLATSASTKYAGDQQRAREEQQREAQRRVTPGPSGQPTVPGAPPPQPYPGPPGSQSGPSNCGAPNCVSTTVNGGNNK